MDYFIIMGAFALAFACMFIILRYMERGGKDGDN